MTTKVQDTSHRLTIMLKLLGPEVTEQVMSGLPANQRAHLEQQLALLDTSPPSNREIDEVLREFNDLMQLAGNALVGSVAFPQVGPQERDGTKLDDPFAAINEVSDDRLVAALRDESPRTAALVLNVIDEKKAARVLQALPTQLRDAVVLQLKEKLTPSLALLTKLMEATLEKCQTFVEEELAAEKENSDGRVANLLRTMTPEGRGEVLTMLQEADAESAERIRNRLFSFTDLQYLKDRSIQKVLAEVDGGTLAIALKFADDDLQARLLSNLSKRARASLQEEMELLGDIGSDERAAAELAIIKVMVELDKIGELQMDKGE